MARKDWELTIFNLKDLKLNILIKMTNKSILDLKISVLTQPKLVKEDQMLETSLKKLIKRCRHKNEFPRKSNLILILLLKIRFLSILTQERDIIPGAKPEMDK